MVYISLILIIAIFLYRFEKRVIQISFANFEEKKLNMKRFFNITASLSMKTRSFPCVILFTVILLSMSCKRQIYDIYGNYNDRVFQSYIVDTIKIDDPVIIECENLFYVLDRKHLTQDAKSSINSDFAYVMGLDLYYDLYYKQNKEDWPHYKDNGDCHWTWNHDNASPFNMATFNKNPCYFILALINARFYVKMHTSIDAPIGFSSYGQLFILSVVNKNV